MEIAKFYKEVKAETTRISWPSRKETMTASGLVFVLATIAGLFFLLVDAAVYKMIHFILGL
jgi:preprotein translocase subunit SecE